MTDGFRRPLHQSIACVYVKAPTEDRVLTQMTGMLLPATVRDIFCPIAFYLSAKLTVVPEADREAFTNDHEC